jgi:cystathionine beta-lyase/cystathionine gamma-synthase
MPDKPQHSFTTRAVHAGERLPQPAYTPVSGPIHLSVGYTYETMEELEAAFTGAHLGPVYLRYGSPTVSAFEHAVADLEGGEAALAYASGMAAVHAALLAAGMRRGSAVVAALDVYGATFALINRLSEIQGAHPVWVDTGDLAAVEQALAAHPGAVLLAEVISNPLLKVADVEALARLARRFNAAFLVDSTFSTPCLISPLDLGADYVIHSATKYLAGHGDLMAGVVVTSQDNHAHLYEMNKLTGANLGPFEAWLALRGLKTLPLRFERQCQNAALIAAWLAEQPQIERVIYPGLPGHPQHELALRQFAGKGFGGMLSFEIRGADQGRAFRFMESLELIQPATTLGDIYSLVLHPATSSHRLLTAEERREVGISEGLLRLSAGIESAEDIIGDLEQALRE